MKNYSLSEVSAKLGKSRQWIWVLIVSGKLTATKVGNQYIIFDEELNNYLNEQKKGK